MGILENISMNSEKREEMDLFWSGEKYNLRILVHSTLHSVRLQSYLYIPG